MRDALAPFVGKKVRLVGGDKTKEFRSVTEAVVPAYSHKTQVWVEFTNYSVYLRCKVCEIFPKAHHDAAYYAETSVCVGSVNGQILEKVDTQDQAFRTDYAPEAIVQARKELEKAKDKVREIENLLAGFGEYDN